MNDLSGNPLFDTPVMRTLTEILDSLKPAQRKVGEFILRNPLRAAMLSISEIGRESDTSPAAVNRLGNRLGMNGFTGLRMALVNHLLMVISPHLQIIPEPDDASFTLLAHLRSSQGQAVQAGQHNAEHVFVGAVQTLCNAERLLVLGGARCHPLAQVLEQQLIPYNPSCLAVCLNGGLELATRRVQGLKPGDVLVVMSLPPYNNDAIYLAELAEQNGVSVIAVTDSPASPLAGDITLYAPCDSSVNGTGLVPAFSLIDALIAGINAHVHEHDQAALNTLHNALAAIKQA